MFGELKGIGFFFTHDPIQFGYYYHSAAISSGKYMKYS